MFKQFIVAGIGELMGTDKPFSVEDLAKVLAAPGWPGSGISSTPESQGVAACLTRGISGSRTECVAATLRSLEGTIIGEVIDGQRQLLRNGDGRYVVAYFVPPEDASLKDKLLQTLREGLAASVK
jgi:hypothetical protein